MMSNPAGLKSTCCRPRFLFTPARVACVWPLGDFGVHVDGDDDAVKSAGDTIQINPKIDSHIIGMASDYAGYQPAYDSFTACISAGNTIDPIEDYGAICDGKHDTLNAFVKAGAETAKLPIGSVAVPNDCAMNKITIRSTWSAWTDGSSPNPHITGGKLEGHGETGAP